MKLIALGSSVVLFCLTLSAPDDESELRRQSDAHQMFLLRDALSSHPRASDFYSGQVACAFNDVATCEEKLKKVLAGERKSATAKQIHDILANVAMREGRYARCLHEIEALLALDPNDRDARGTRQVIEPLSHFPDQAVHESGTIKVTVQMDGEKLPILINGRKAAYFFDTGANLSLITESEASRFGMEIKEVKAGGVSGDIHGNKLLCRIAVAKSLALGGRRVEQCRIPCFRRSTTAFCRYGAGATRIDRATGTASLGLHQVESARGI